MLRSPVVAGRFYPARPEILREDLGNYVIRAAQPIPAVGCVVPHAGYMYSGKVAGEVYGAIELPGSFVILCPNHSGHGRHQAILSSGEWLTPLGRVAVDASLAARIMRECPQVSEDAAAHAQEHSLEVQLPFLQHLLPRFSIVPIALGGVSFPDLEALGEGLARAISAGENPALIIASSDMNHYEPDSITREKDRQAIERILALDARGLYDTVRSLGITMCGYAATVAMLVALAKLGAKEGKLVRYATSGDVTGDREEVVGYAGIVLS
jgi:MEMO1 family protein